MGAGKAPGRSWGDISVMHAQWRNIDEVEGRIGDKVLKLRMRADIVLRMG